MSNILILTFVLLIVCSVIIFAVKALKGVIRVLLPVIVSILAIIGLFTLLPDSSKKIINNEFANISKTVIDENSNTRMKNGDIQFNINDKWVSVDDLKKSKVDLDNNFIKYKDGKVLLKVGNKWRTTDYIVNVIKSCNSDSVKYDNGKVKVKIKNKWCDISKIKGVKKKGKDFKVTINNKSYIVKNKDVKKVIEGFID